MSLANIQGKLSRAEMKNIMAGSGSGLFCGGHNLVWSASKECCTNQGLKCSNSELGHFEYN